MKVKYQFISKPDENTLSILKNRLRPAERKAMDNGEYGEIGATLLVEGQIPDMIKVADVAVKASDVRAAEIVGNCPQSFVTIGIFGKIRSVQTALKAILSEDPNRENAFLGDV